MKLTTKVGGITKIYEGTPAEIREYERGESFLFDHTHEFDGKELARRISEGIREKFDSYKPEPELTRAEVVAKAKRDVVDKFFEGNVGVGKVINGFHGHNKVEFIINREKRTVVALLDLAYCPGNISAKGIAKAAPDDVFNADIGKAIALRRALGLDVPSEYTNAPKPEGVRVGDVIDRAGETWTVVGHPVDSIDIADKKTCVGSSGAESGTVIDDTDRRGYE